MANLTITRLPGSVFLTDRSGPLPLYLQIATRLEDAIRAGDLLPAEFGHHCYRPDLFSFEITLVDH